MKTENIGILVILGGVAVFGYIYFQKQKPKIAQKQLDDLIKQSNGLNDTTNVVDPAFNYNNPTTQTQIGQANTLLNNVTNPFTPDFNTMTPADISAVQSSISPAVTNAVNIGTSTIAQNMASASTQASLNQLANYDFSNINWAGISFANLHN